MKITIKQGSITSLHVDAIVNPANSSGYMGGGVAGHLKKMGGEEIEEEAIHQAHIDIGEAVLTTAGLLKARHIIHVPTMEQPAEKTDTHKIKCAVEAALELADANKFIKIAMPGMGTGVGGVSLQDAAKVMIETIKAFKAKHLQEVILIDINQGMVTAWKACT